MLGSWRLAYAAHYLMNIFQCHFWVQAIVLLELREGFLVDLQLDIDIFLVWNVWGGTIEPGISVYLLVLELVHVVVDNDVLERVWEVR